MMSSAARLWTLWFLGRQQWRDRFRLVALAIQHHAVQQSASGPAMIATQTIPEFALHSGAVYKSHDLTPYQSLNSWHGLKLNYDSERADAPANHQHRFQRDPKQSSQPNRWLQNYSISHGNLRDGRSRVLRHPVGPNRGRTFLRLPGRGPHRWTLRSRQTCEICRPESTSMNQSTGLPATRQVRLPERLRWPKISFVHVNTMASPFGAGWGVSGLLEIVENPDGSVLLVDGDGGELLFEAPAEHGRSLRFSGRRFFHADQAR